MLWLDNESGSYQMETREKVAELLDRCVEAGINTIAVDVKNWFGLGFYQSEILPHPGQWQGQEYPPDYDLLQGTIEEGHRRGLKVHAALNVFAEGAKNERLGEAWNHPDWESVVSRRQYFLTDGEGAETPIQWLGETSGEGLFFADSRFGCLLARQDSAASAVDGNYSSILSRWVSAVTPTPHVLEVTLDAPEAVHRVVLHFVRGYIPVEFELILEYEDTIHSHSWKNNTLQKVEWDTPADQPLHKLLLKVTDSGLDEMIRLAELELLDAEGNRIESELSARASSSLERGRGLFAEVVGGRIRRMLEERDIPDSGLKLNEDSLFLIARGDKARQALQSWEERENLSLELRDVLLRTTQVPGGLIIYADPNHPQVRARMLAVLREIVTNYDVDGITLDRVRYDNFQVDFSERSRRSFEEFLGRSLSDWPGEIVRWADPAVGGEPVRGPEFKNWVHWRASVIHDFIVEAREAVKSIRPEVEFGDYVGAWYPTYWQVGVNWAASGYDPSKDYDWATETYHETGYAEHLDYLSPGLYYSDITIEDARANQLEAHLSIEGGLELVKQVTQGKTRIIGGLYFPNLHQPERFIRATRLMLEQSDGVMIFSQVNFDSPERWAMLKEALATP